MEDKEIIKALEDLVKCNNNEIDCDNCSLSVFYPRCPEEIGELALDLINRLEAEKEVLEARIGVYETCNARKDEAIKHLEAENERLKAPTTDWLVRGISPEQLEQEKIQAFTEEINRLQAENERLKAENDNLKNGFFQEYYKTEECQELLSVRKAWEKAQMDYIKLDTEWEGKYKTAKAEAYKEFADKVKAKFCRGYYYLEIWEKAFSNGIDNLLKELVGDSNET